ncbi:restriction endonuclease subunit S [Streptococcus australis]|uniref:restriction endonuclease subunit S n=1 Tax=Streptococcus australis TaxID=113107 RepID=UPI001CBCD0DD|nr:restriction endonuclease subunit S [Streptococcus australis]MBZ2154855.1 restriction endonuclease subunit S [Streptococcus australis]
MSDISIPNFRFKKYTSNLIKTKLSKIATFNPKSSLPENFKYIDLESVLGTELVSYREETRESAPSRAQRVAQKGDVFYQMVRPYQKNNYLFDLNENNYVFSTGYAQLRPKVDSAFLLARLQEEGFVNKVIERCTGTSYPAINSKDLSRISITIPEDLAEQSAIGSLFRTLDDLLASYKDNLTNYQSLKATMLSKMFPKDGQPVPEIRMNGFEGEWEIKKFKSISTKRGKSNSKGYDYPAYSVSNQSGLIPQSEQFDGSRLENLEKTSYKIVEPNEFAYNPARINVGSIAFNDLDETVIVSSLYVIFSLDKSINNNYALLFIKSPEFNKEVRRNTEGSVREYLFYENFANIRIPIPPSLEEQQAIGVYFSNLDNLVTAHQEKISQLETLKKKLLQDMFI